jgi:uncharacterized protein (DUF4415 family)
MNKRYEKPLTPLEIAALTPDEIDFSDVPELGDEFWSKASLVYPDRTQSVTLRVKQSVLDAFKAGGKGYQTRMNAVLESYVKSVSKQARR